MTHFLTQAIQGLGYLGILVAMALESACIPLPSEVIMPFGGYLVSTGHLGFWPVVVSGTLGNVLGSLLAYAIGSSGGRQAILKYGRRLRISERHLHTAENWFAKRGEVTVLIARLLPGVRTFISLPAGIARMPVGRFTLFTAVGSLPWAVLLTWIGVRLGHEWENIRNYTHPFTYAVALGLVILCFFYFLRARKKRTL